MGLNNNGNIIRFLSIIIINILILNNYILNVSAEEGTPEISNIDIIGPDKVHINEVYQYLISFTNEGDGTATDVVVFNIFPKYFEYLNSNPEGTYDSNDHTITWNYPTIEESQTREITVNFQVMEIAPHLYTSQNWIEISYKDNMENIYSPVDVTFLSKIFMQPICEIQCEVSPTINPGEDYFYQIEVNNFGYLDASNVLIKDFLPANAIYLNSIPPGVYNSNEHSVSWTMSSLPPESMTYFQLIVITDINIAAATVLVNNVNIWWNVPGEQELFGPKSDSDSTTVTGNWIIENQDDITRSNEIITVTGSLIIENGGKLTLNNVKLHFKKPEVGEFGIMIGSGGELITSSNTKIIAFSENEPFFFQISGIASLTETLVSNLMGTDYYEGGVIINNGGELYCYCSQILSCETIGITVLYGGLAEIFSSYIKQNDGDGIHVEGEIIIERSFIEENGGAGIYWNEDGSTSFLELKDVKIEENSIGIFSESSELLMSEKVKIENIEFKNNDIDNIVLYNIKPEIKGKNQKFNDDTIIISSTTVNAPTLTINDDIQIKVLDSNYDPVINTNVIVDDWEIDPACDENTNSEGFVEDVNVVLRVGSPSAKSVSTNYLTQQDLILMPYLNNYFEIIESECQMKENYYFNKIEGEDWVNEQHDIIVDSSYIALEGYDIINPRGIIYTDTSNNNNPAINVIDYDLSTFWCADNTIGSYEILIDLTDAQPIRYLNIYYQYISDQSWFEGESYTIEGYNEVTDEWEEMLSVIEEENIPVREAEAPIKYWSEEYSNNWVSKVRIDIPDWIGTFDPGIRLIDIQDSDLDGLLNWFEISINTNPLDQDSDNDEMGDGYETLYGTTKLPLSWLNPKITNNRYAIIITTDDSYIDTSNGLSWRGYRPWMWNDAMLAYHMLYKRGFSHNNIHFLYEGGSMSPNNQWISWYPSNNIVDGPGTLQELDNTFTTLSSQITANDLLYFYIIGHGTQVAASSNIYDGEILLREALYSDGNIHNVIYDYELDAFMDKINKDARKVIIIESCNAGTFIDDLANPFKANTDDRYRIITGAAPYMMPHNSFTMPHVYNGNNINVAPFSHFGYHFTSALNWMYNDDNSGWRWDGGYDANSKYVYLVDLNKDDEISIWEAHMNEEINDPIGFNVAVWDDDYNPWDQFVNQISLDPDGPGVPFIRRSYPMLSNDGLAGKATVLGYQAGKPNSPPTSTTKINHFIVPL